MCIGFNKPHFMWTACLLKFVTHACTRTWSWRLLACHLSHTLWHWWGNKFTKLWNFTLFLLILQMTTALVCPVAVEADHAYFCKILFTAEWSQYFFFLHWLYGSCRTLPSFRINFQASVSLAVFLQPLTSIFVT